MSAFGDFKPHVTYSGLITFIMSISRVCLLIALPYSDACKRNSTATLMLLLPLLLVTTACDVLILHILHL